MASQIVEIYDALAAIDVAFVSVMHGGGSVTPAVNDIDQLDPRDAQSGNLPLRLLLPYSPAGQGRDFQPFTLSGVSISLTWRVTDLLLLAATGYGRGVIDATPDLVRYQAAYAAQMAANVSILSNASSKATVTDLQTAAGEYEFPRGSGSVWFAVENILTIQELVK